MKTRIVILGSGNVAWHLAHNFVKAGCQVLEVYGRHPDKEADMYKALGNINYITDIHDLSQTSDIYFICVKDDAIEDVANAIPFELREDQILVHTSGTVPSSILSSYARMYGCFWPVQTLTRGKEIVSDELTVAITASQDYVEIALVQLADRIAYHSKVVSDEKRKKLHMAAVITNNFGYFLLTMAYDYCQKEDLDFKLLTSLIKETAYKANAPDFPESQTGPARRNDLSTIQQHLNMLSAYPELYKYYSLFTESIIQKYHHS